MAAATHSGSLPSWSIRRRAILRHAPLGPATCWDWLGGGTSATVAHSWLYVLTRARWALCRALDAKWQRQRRSAPRAAQNAHTDGSDASLSRRTRGVDAYEEGMIRTHAGPRYLPGSGLRRH